MQYRRLGRSGLKISEISLGSNTFGGLLSEKEAISVILHGLDLGINYIDTADVYNQGHSEELVGRAIKGRRSDVIIATKFSGTMGTGPNDAGNSRYHIMQAIDASLKRLGTDYIDIYQIHKPDPMTPIEETLQTLDNLVRSGKVRYIGCSSFDAWQLCDAIWTSRMHNLEGLIMVMTEYNLIHRQPEAELIPCCEKYGIGVIPYRPIAAGFLSDEYVPGKPIPPNTRLSEQSPIMRRVAAEAVEHDDKLNKLRKFAEDRGYHLSDLAIAWLLSHPWLTTVIAGATTLEQVSSNVSIAEWRLTAEDCSEISSILNE